MTKRLTRASGSLIERAADAYDFRSMLRGTSAAEPELFELPAPSTSAARPRPIVATDGPVVPLDIHLLRDTGFIIPGAPPNALSEEFRLIKRQLLLAAIGSNSGEPVKRGRLILVCSAQPNEGKTFCSVNLALSMASESDTEVLLVDADVAKPEILSTLGLPGSAGLMDALADPSINVESLIVRTNVQNLSVLPAGRQTNNDTELLASVRTRSLIDGLIATNSRRIVLFDSAPALAASPASVLALHVGQVLMVVRADQTTEHELRDALTLIDACPHIQLMLNAVTYRGSNRKFGSYYGFGE